MMMEEVGGEEAEGMEYGDQGQADPEMLYGDFEGFCQTYPQPQDIYFDIQEQAIQIVENRKRLLAEYAEKEGAAAAAADVKKEVAATPAAESHDYNEGDNENNDDDEDNDDERWDNYLVMSLDNWYPYPLAITPITPQELEAKKNEQNKELYDNEGLNPSGSQTSSAITSPTVEPTSAVTQQQPAQKLPQSFAEKTHEEVMRARERESHEIRVLRPGIDAGMRLAIDQNPKYEPFYYNEIKNDEEEDNGDDDDVMIQNDDAMDDVSSKILTKQKNSAESRKRKRQPWEENPESAKSYFNYGFDGDTWELYMHKQKKLKRLMCFTDSIDVFDGLSTFSQVSVVRGYRLLSELANVSQSATAMDTPTNALDDAPQIILDSEPRDTREEKMPLRRSQVKANVVSEENVHPNESGKERIENKNDVPIATAPDTPPMSPPSSPDDESSHNHDQQHHNHSHSSSSSSSHHSSSSSSSHRRSRHSRK